MGCDIHMYKEKFIGDKWVTADEWVAYDYGDDEGDKGFEVPFAQRFADRNYQLFGILSKGVRYEQPFSFLPRGLPFDCSPEISRQKESWGGDGHSHSYLFLHELKAMQRHLQTANVSISGMKDADELKALRKSIASGSPKWDLLFPYCGWTSDSSYEEFTLDVPASFYVGASLAQIIASFDGIEGDNHRIVFFFDN